MSEPRNEYGFPLGAVVEQREYPLGTPAFWSNLIATMYDPCPSRMSKLERAQAYAAEVRARKFPAPHRITPKDEPWAP